MKSSESALIGAVLVGWVSAPAIAFPQIRHHGVSAPAYARLGRLRRRKGGAGSRCVVHRSHAFVRLRLRTL